MENIIDYESDQNDHEMLSEHQSSLIKLEKRDENNQQPLSLSQDKKFSCKNCYKHFNRRNSLDRHIKQIHEGQSYMCDKCDYKGTRKEHLRAHSESVHDGVRYSCDHCSYKATRKDNLKAHVKSLHKDVEK